MHWCEYRSHTCWPVQPSSKPQLKQFFHGSEGPEIPFPQDSSRRVQRAGSVPAGQEYGGAVAGLR